MNNRMNNKTDIKIYKTRIKGAATLTLVIVMQWMLLVLGLSLIIVNINITKASSGYNNYLSARFVTRTCLEESLRLISRNLSYTGTYNYTDVNGASCSSSTVIDGSNSNLRNITITSVNDNYHYDELRVLDVSTSPYSLID